MSRLTSIIILTYNQLKFTKICLQALYKWTRVPFELIVVDNGSTDGTVPYLKSLNCRLIRNKKNLGFSRGVNQGIRAARGDYLMLLNNDTIPANNWLKNQIDCLESRPEIGIVGPRSNNAVGDQVGIECDFKRIDAITKFSNSYNKADPQKWFKTDLIIGFCMLIKKEVVDKVGLFDEGYKIGLFEDADFCWRAKEKGFTLYCAGDTFVYHFAHRTFAGNNIPHKKLAALNRERFQTKWNTNRW